MQLNVTARIIVLIQPLTEQKQTGEVHVTFESG